MKKNLWKFSWDCGRSGVIEGLFVAHEEEIRELVGKELYFGEVLGKHSEIFGEFEEGDAVKVDLDPEIIEEATKVLGETWSGYNPLEYVPED